MSVLLNAYLNFDGTARQAMEFYADILGGDLTISTFGEFGDTSNPDGVMHSQLMIPGGMAIMASDMPPGMERQAGNNLGMSLSGEDEATLRGYWERLSEGGTVSMPMEKQMWGDTMGACTDKFGLDWMVNITAPAA